MKIRNILGAAVLAALPATQSSAEDEFQGIDLCGNYPLCTYYHTEHRTPIRAHADRADTGHPSRMLIDIFEKKGLMGGAGDLQKVDEDAPRLRDFGTNSLG
jgi:hypothetical protein